jgi:hypothetical protein
MGLRLVFFCRVIEATGLGCFFLLPSLGNVLEITTTLNDK